MNNKEQIPAEVRAKIKKATNRADTAKWKKKRKDHFGAKCSRAKCGICAGHKSLGNNKGSVKAKYKLTNNEK